MVEPIVNNEGKKNKRVLACFIEQKVKAMTQGGKLNKNKRGLIAAHLDELNNMALRVAETVYEKKTSTTATQHAPEDRQKDGQKSKHLEGTKENTTDSKTDHVLFINSVDKQEITKSLEKRLTGAIDPKILNVDVTGKRTLQFRGLLVHLSSKKRCGNS